MAGTEGEKVMPTGQICATTIDWYHTCTDEDVIATVHYTVTDNSLLSTEVPVMSGLRRLRSTSLSISAGVFAFAAGCADSALVDPTSRTLSAVTVSGRPYRGVEGHFAALAQAVPTFSGYYYDRAGNLNVAVTNLADTNALHPALAFLLHRRQSGHGSYASDRRILFRHVPFSFTELSRWREILFRVGFSSVPGMHALAIDERAARLVAGVASEADESRLREIARAAGIPYDVLLVRVAGPERDLALLTDRVNPILGGLLITTTSGIHDCTLGFNTYSGTYFLTASHCTNQLGPEPIESRTTFWQPYQSHPESAYIGYETSDPAYWVVDGAITCPSSTGCRYSDAALFVYSASAPGAVGQGKTWRTTFPSFGNNGSGSNEIENQFTITNEADYAIDGEILDKIGWASGWTYGYVVQTCVDVRSDDTGAIYICQDIVSATAHPGDSGAPVFRFEYSYDVTAIGLLRGWNETFAGFSVSGLGAIWYEIGYVPVSQ